jgi:hypothetical protein
MNTSIIITGIIILMIFILPFAWVAIKQKRK